MISMSQNYTAIAAGITASFLATGGTGPYIYSVRNGGAGGTIDPNTGVYQAPTLVNPNPAQANDVIQARDNLGAISTASILVTTPLGLFADIIQNQLAIAADHIYFWDQKIFQPTDSNMYVVISVLNCKPFGNQLSYSSVSSGLNQNNYVTMAANITVDAISRGPAARDQKELIQLALCSTYSEQQQEANSFYIGRIPTSFVNLSQVDGAAIPYRFQQTYTMQYAVSFNPPVSYFDTFATPKVTANS